MRRTVKKQLFAALALAVFLLPGAVAAIDEAHIHSAGLQTLNEAAPEFSVIDSAGRSIGLKDMKGKPMLLHFWATWCAPCREEFPAFEKLYKEFGGKGLEVLAVSIDSSAGIDDVKNKAAGYGATFPVYLARQGKITASYWTWGVPVTYFIDKRGMIIARGTGPQNWAGDGIRKLVRELIEEK